MNMNLHTTGVCPPDTRQNCSLIQSYYEIILKDFIYCYINGYRQYINLYINSILICLEARVNEVIRRGYNTNSQHYFAIIDTLLFYTLLLDIDRQDRRWRVNDFLNSEVIRLGINMIIVDNVPANIDFRTIGRNAYRDFLDRILDYNRDRTNLNCINNEHVIWYDNFNNMKNMIISDQTNTLPNQIISSDIYDMVRLRYR